MSADRFLLLQKVQRVLPSIAYTDRLYISGWVTAISIADSSRRINTDKWVTSFSSHTPDVWNGLPHDLWSTDISETPSKTHRKHFYMTMTHSSALSASDDLESLHKWHHYELPGSHVVSAEVHFIVVILQCVGSAVLQPINDQLQSTHRSTLSVTISNIHRVVSK